MVRRVLACNTVTHSMCRVESVQWITCMDDTVIVEEGTT